MITRPIHTADALARLEERLNHRAQRKVAVVPHGGESFGVEFVGVEHPQGEAERLARAAAEADVVAAARRSQLEIRRHVDAYLKEHFETLAAQVTSAVLAEVTSRVTSGIAAAAETQGLALDRLAADIRSQLRAYARGVAHGPKDPKKAGGKRARQK
jgi:hypothetical protein